MAVGVDEEAMPVPYVGHASAICGPLPSLCQSGTGKRKRAYEQQLWPVSSSCADTQRPRRSLAASLLLPELPSQRCLC